MNRLFEELLHNRKDFLNAKKGGDFENRVESFLKPDMHYTKILTDKVKGQGWDHLKELVLDRVDDDPIVNSYDVDESFISQPNGTQNYPDFLVFHGNEVVCIETKFSKPGHPVWNSGLPRPNGFYILGSPAEEDITFFRGCDVVSVDDAQKLHDFFQGVKRRQIRFNEENMKEQRKGVAVYIRKAFEQKKQFNPDADMNFYKSPDRKQFEQNVLDYFDPGE